MASEVPVVGEAAAAAAAAAAAEEEEEEALANLSAVSLSASTNRGVAWREKGITFRPYSDERDMVRFTTTKPAFPFHATAHMLHSQVALGAMVDRDLSEPYSMFTYRKIPHAPAQSHASPPPPPPPPSPPSSSSSSSSSSSFSPRTLNLPSLIHLLFFRRFHSILPLCVPPRLLQRRYDRLRRVQGDV